MCTEELVSVGGIDYTDCNVANDVAGGLGVPEGSFVTSDCSLLTHPSSPVFVKVSEPQKCLL